jgi:sugar-phosphatase
MKIRTRGLLFDMDGILISSIGSVERSWALWAQARNMDVTEIIANSHGQRALDIIRKLVPPEEVDAEFKRIEEIECEDTEGLQVLEGVKPILDTIPQKFWTIVTSATERLARVRLCAGGIPVPENFVTSERVRKGKPDPEPYVKGAQLLGLDPLDCLVIEDSASGARAGKAAGCRVMATLFSHKKEDLEAADYVVRSLADVTVRILPGNYELQLEFEDLNEEPERFPIRRV